MTNKKTDNSTTLPKKKARTSVTLYDQNHCHHEVTVEQWYLNLLEDMVEDNPLDQENIKEKQDEDDRLIQSTVKHPTWYSCKTINDVEDIQSQETMQSIGGLHYLKI
jgi:hypothetical protein